MVSYLAHYDTLLRNAADVITKCDSFITKCDSSYKMRQLLQNMMFIAECLGTGWLWNFRTMHCLKIVQIRSFLWSVFSSIWTEYGDLRSRSPCSVRMQENMDRKNAIKIIM